MGASWGRSLLFVSCVMVLGTSGLQSLWWWWWWWRKANQHWFLSQCIHNDKIDPLWLFIALSHVIAFAASSWLSNISQKTSSSFILGDGFAQNCSTKKISWTNAYIIAADTCVILIKSFQQLLQLHLFYWSDYFQYMIHSGGTWGDVPCFDNASIQ